MNSSIYIFGELAGGYTQYPHDYTQTTYQEFGTNLSSPSELAIWREGALMHYIYLRELVGDSKYIGISFVVNGVIIYEYRNLFSLFEDAITKMIVSGNVIEFTLDGNITSHCDHLHLVTSEFKSIASELGAILNSCVFEQIPPINYAINKNASQSFNYDDDGIEDSIRNYHITIIKKGGEPKWSSYSSKLNLLNRTNKELNETNKQLQAQNARLNQQKKRTTLVTLLSIALAVGLLTLLQVRDDAREKGITINQLQKDYNNAQTHIADLQEDSIRLSNNVDNINQRLYALQGDYRQLESINKQLENLRDSLKREIEVLSSLSTYYTESPQYNSISSSEKRRIMNDYPSSQKNNHTFSVSNTNLTFGPHGGKTTLAVYTDSPWSFSVLPNEWVGKVTSNGNTITVIVKENPYGTRRTDYFKIKSGNQEIKINITQTEAW